MTTTELCQRLAGAAVMCDQLKILPVARLIRKAKHALEVVTADRDRLEAQVKQLRDALGDIQFRAYVGLSSDRNDDESIAFVMENDSERRELSAP